MRGLDMIFVGILFAIGTMWLTKNVCQMKMFQNWGRTKHVMFVIGLLIGTFYLKHLLVRYAGMDIEVMWVRLMGTYVSFPRYLLVFGLVNLLLPGVFVLFFRTVEKEESFWKATLGATSCLSLAGFSWHLVYTIPRIDESIAFFAALVITIMILYGYRLAIKQEIIVKPKTWIGSIFFIGSVIAFFAIAAWYVIRMCGEFNVGRIFREMDCGYILPWLYFAATILGMYVIWYLWKKCSGFSRRVFALPAALMPTFRWGYAILMNFGLLPELEEFVGIPYDDKWMVYDWMCIGIVLMCVFWKERNRKMLLVRIPKKVSNSKVSMIIEDEMLEKIIDEKFVKNEESKEIMKKFFRDMSMEVEGDVLAWIQFASFLYEFGCIEGEEDMPDEIVSHVIVNGSDVYLFGDTEESIEAAKIWLEKEFIGKGELQFTEYIVPKNRFFNATDVWLIE